MLNLAAWNNINNWVAWGLFLSSLSQPSSSPYTHILARTHLLLLAHIIMQYKYLLEPLSPLLHAPRGPLPRLSPLPWSRAANQWCLIATSASPGKTERCASVTSSVRVNRHACIHTAKTRRKIRTDRERACAPARVLESELLLMPGKWSVDGVSRLSCSRAQSLMEHQRAL